jgi:hypothetical protein
MTKLIEGMKTKRYFVIALLAVLSFAACEQGPGEGGTSTIRGKVVVREYDFDFQQLRATYPAAKEDVYIIYGDDFVYGDRFETSMDGAYEFTFLKEGTYKIFAYSADSIPPFTDERVAIIKEVQITDKNQVVEVPDIIILEN